MAHGKTLAFLGLCVFLFAACDYGAEELFGRDDEVGTRSASLVQVSPPSNSITFPYTVVVISDVHFGRESRDGVPHEEAIAHFDKWLKGQPIEDRPLFIVCLGDVTEHGEEDEVKQYAAWLRTLEKIPNSGGTIKVYNAIGNHDLYNSGLDVWHREVYPKTFYYFKAGGISWYFIDTASGAVGRKQYNALKDAFHSDDAPKVILSHFPLFAEGNFYFCMQNTTERNLLIAMFARASVAAVFTGHTHYKHTDNFGHFTEYNVPSLLDKRQWAVVEIKGQGAGGHKTQIECNIKIEG